MCGNHDRLSRRPLPPRGADQRNAFAIGERQFGEEDVDLAAADFDQRP